MMKSKIYFDLDYTSNGTIYIIDSNNEVNGEIINLPIQVEKLNSVQSN